MVEQREYQHSSGNTQLCDGESGRTHVCIKASRASRSKPHRQSCHEIHPRVRQADLLPLAVERFHLLAPCMGRLIVR
jgi:hypothetical protein